MIDVILKGSQGDVGRMIDRLVMSNADNASVLVLTAASQQKGGERQECQEQNMG